MMDCMRKLVLEKYCRPVQNSLDMEDEKARMTVAITQIPGPGLWLKLPSEGKAHSGILQSKKGYRQSCDGMIFIPRKDGLHVYLVELKTTLDPNWDGVPEAACKQILSTIPVMDYLIAMAKIHCQEKEQKLYRHLVVIAKKKAARLDKQGVKVEKFQTCRYAGKTFKVIHSAAQIPLRALQQAG